MHPELFTLPILGMSIKTYGFFLMLGFLSAVWLAMKRAARVKADPDRVIDVSFFALLFGVGGARLFYVVHYWERDFALASNKLLAIIDIRQGGLEFLGGLLGAMAAILIYLIVKKQSVRLYLDIIAPSAMWGLAFGRIGCFFNGCCFGGLCVASANNEPALPWAVRFPFGSPAHMRQWEERQVTIPAELLNTAGMMAYPLPATTLHLSVEKRERPQREVERVQAALTKAKTANADGAEVQELESQLKSKKAALAAATRKHHLADLEWAQHYPSRRHPERKTSVSELEQLAAQCQSLPVHPTQLYASANAFLLYGLLAYVFYLRKRHGVVIGLLLLLYPISRVLLEMIRVDNPHDVAGLTISQFISVVMAIFAVAYLIILYKVMPQRSPYADAAKPAEPNETE